MQAVFGVWLLLGAASQADYVIVQRVEGSMHSGVMTLKLKALKSRADITEELSTISDAATGEVITLMHGQKRFMKISAEQNKALEGQVEKLQDPNAPLPKLTATGKHEKVQNYDCEIFTWETPGLHATYWVAHDFPNYPAILEAVEKNVATGLTAPSRLLTPRVTELPGMIIKTEMSAEGQKLLTTLISVTEETLDPALFTIPPGYLPTPAPAFQFPGK